MTDDVIRQLGYLALGTRLKRLGERLQADTQRILDDGGAPIQAAQFPFLAALDRLGRPTVGALAAAIGVSQPLATRTLGALAEAGLVGIATAEDDQRRRLVGLTPKGARLVELGKREIWPRVEAAVRDLCAARSGPLLEQLAAIEDSLAEVPLAQRAAADLSPGAGRRTAAARRPAAQRRATVRTAARRTGRSA